MAAPRCRLITTCVGLVAAGSAFCAAVSAQPQTQAAAPARVPFAAVDRILARDCGACHNDAGASAMGNLSFDPGEAYAALVGKSSTQSPLERVKPGKPDQSYLLAKLEGWHARAGGQGETMPLGQGKLPAEKITLIRTWIAQGALPE